MAPVTRWLDRGGPGARREEEPDPCVQNSAAGRRRHWLALCLASMSGLALSAPAMATMHDSGAFEDHDAFSYDDCGFTVDASSVFGGRYHNRSGTGPDVGAFFSHTKFWFPGRSHVPRDGGRTLVVEGAQLSQDTPARGSRVTSSSSGPWFPARDGQYFGRQGHPAGRRDDQAGLPDRHAQGRPPGRADFVMVSYSWAGPHPGETSDWCSLFQ